MTDPKWPVNDNNSTTPKKKEQKRLVNNINAPENTNPKSVEKTKVNLKELLNYHNPHRAEYDVLINRVHQESMRKQEDMKRKDDHYGLSQFSDMWLGLIESRELRERIKVLLHNNKGSLYESLVRRKIKPLLENDILIDLGGGQKVKLDY